MIFTIASQRQPGGLKRLDTHWTFSLAAQFTLNFYDNTHPYYCGIDLHAISFYVCIIYQPAKVIRKHQTTRVIAFQVAPVFK